MEKPRGVILVSGTSWDLGWTIAKSLAKEDRPVALQGHGPSAIFSEQVQIPPSGLSNVHLFPVDLGLPGAAGHLVEKVDRSLGQPTILIHWVEADTPSPALSIPLHDWWKAFELKVFSGLALAKAMMRHLRKAGNGRMVFVGCVQGERPEGNESLDAAINGALTGLAKTLALECARWKTTVNVVLPFSIDGGLGETEGHEKAWGGMGSVPLKHAGHPEEILPLVRFLCSPQAGSLTGQVFRMSNDPDVLRGIPPLGKIF